MNECPICGEMENFNRSCDYEHLEPYEEWCDFCGFYYRETRDTYDYDKAIDSAVDQIEVMLDTYKDELKFWNDFKENKVSRLKKIDFNYYKKRYGYKNNGHGFCSRPENYWDLVKEGKIKMDEESKGNEELKRGIII